MVRTYFTKEQARQKIGSIVEAQSDFPSVPTGSKGEVIKAQLWENEQWVVKVRWKTNRPGSYILAMFVDVSINFPMKAATVADLFCKSEFESLLKTLESQTTRTCVII